MGEEVRHSLVIEPIYSTLAAWVRHRRKWCGYTQDELAFQLGLSRTSIVNFEAGKQRILFHTAMEMIELLSHDPRPAREFVQIIPLAYGP